MEHVETDHIGKKEIKTAPMRQSRQIQAINSLLETSSQRT